MDIDEFKEVRSPEVKRIQEASKPSWPPSHRDEPCTTPLAYPWQLMDLLLLREGFTASEYEVPRASREACREASARNVSLASERWKPLLARPLWALETLLSRGIRVIWIIMCPERSSSASLSAMTVTRPRSWTARPAESTMFRASREFVDPRVQEFQTILNWLGFCWPAERTQKVLAQALWVA